MMSNHRRLFTVALILYVLASSLVFIFALQYIITHTLKQDATQVQISLVPTTVPTSIPSSVPTTVPTSVPTTAPTSVPTLVPTVKPVVQQKDNFFESFSLNGEWQYLQTGSEETDYSQTSADLSLWRKMNLPTNWYLAGLNYHGVIWFRREFPANLSWQGRLVQIDFEGVDYFADIWLNGQKIGQHAGFFQPFSFNVSRQIRYGDANVLVVRVNSPSEEYNTVWPLRKTLIKGIFGQDRARPGGAWGKAGQEYNTGGIWNDIRLNVSNFVTIDQTRYQASWPVTLPQQNSPIFEGQVVLTNGSAQPAAVEIHLTLTPANFYENISRLAAKQIALQPGQNTIDLEMPVENPRLWWPWDRGQPNLYTVKLQILMGGAEIASQETVFGFRDVKVSARYEWTVNGQKYFPRGTNYASSQWLTQATPDLLLQDANLIRTANLNLVRVYAHVEPPQFYNLMDWAGILVWQDFPLIWGYADTPAFADSAQTQLGQMITQLYNHPSIVVWCMHEESPWATGSLASQVSNYDALQNKRLDESLQTAAKKLDPTRYIHLNSGTGDNHVFAGWSTGGWTDYARLPGQPFVTEYGAQALPGMEMMLKIFNQNELNYSSGEARDRWIFNDFQYDETFNIAKIDVDEIENISPLAVFITNSQAYQANLIQYATETYRRAKYDPMTGIFQYMFVDEWPSISWSVVDVRRQPKPGYEALKTAMQPILPSILPTQMPARLNGRSWVYPDASGLGFSLWVVNDTLDIYEGASLEWSFSTGGKVVSKSSRSIDIGVDRAEEMNTLANLGLPPGAYRLEVNLKDAKGALLGTNAFMFEILPPPAAK